MQRTRAHRNRLVSATAPAGAFTLLEMLVAMAIMVVLAGSLYATLSIAFRARRSATSTVEETRKVEIGLALLRADLQAAVVPSGILAGAFVGEQGTDAAGRAADSLLFHCTAPGAEPVEGTGDVRMVEFACVEDGGENQYGNEAGLVLVRRITTNLLAPTTPEPDQEVLCRGVYGCGPTGRPASRRPATTRRVSSSSRAAPSGRAWRWRFPCFDASHATTRSRERASGGPVRARNRADRHPRHPHRPDRPGAHAGPVDAD